MTNRTDSNAMFPTRSKAKIPSSLSYPVGAQFLSDALRDVSQASQLSIGFYYFVPLHRKDGRKQPFPILAAEYNYQKPGISSSNVGIALGWHSPRWTLTVWPVLLIFRSLLTASLLLRPRTGALRQPRRGDQPPRCQGRQSRKGIQKLGALGVLAVKCAGQLDPRTVR